MNTFAAFVVLSVIVVAVWALLERNHRRTAGLPRAPFGADLEHDADLQRLLHDLDGARVA